MPTTDHNLLFGVLALQMDFIGRDDLISAMNAWVLDKAHSLGEILLAMGRLTDDEDALLTALVRKHLEKHHGDPEKSLAALHPDAAVRAELARLPDPGLRARVAHTFAESDPEATAAYHPPEADGAPGRFEILRPHARGGLGEVFVALDRELHREVALKEIQPPHATHAESRARFVREAEITGALEHPGVVPVYGLGHHADGRPFYAMRFVRGDSLKDAIARFHEGDQRRRSAGERSLALRQLLGRFLDVCHAVAYAHSRGVLHRDLKPANVMLGEYGETLVVDWGLAKPFDRVDGEPAEALAVHSSVDPDLTQAGRALGTPAFMSPEQAEGRLDRLGPASDVYSLGATLYCLLTGRPPFAEGDALEVMVKVQRGDFPAPRQVNRLVPAALQAVCLRAMALRPEDRYASASELAEEVEHWLADEPVRAYREPLSARAGRWLRRHQALAAGAGALLLAALLALAGGTVLIGSAQRETARALQNEEQARKERALAQVAALLNAEPEGVPALLDGLKAVRGDVLPRLRALWAEKDQPQAAGQRSRVGLALLPVDAAAVKGWLQARLLTAEDPRELLLLRSGLKAHRDELRQELWQRVNDKKARPDERFRALAALAAYDPGSRRWPQVRREVARGLVGVNPLHLKAWADAFRPVRDLLVEPLREVFVDARRPGAERDRAADLLADYAGDRPDTLADLITEADARVYARLLPRLKAHGVRALAPLQRELNRRPKPAWNDPPLDIGWSAPDPKLVRAIEEAHGLVDERFALVQTLPLERFEALAEGLRPAGYRPVRVRPFRRGKEIAVAAVWTRDVRNWRLALGLKGENVTARVGPWRQDGFVPVDVAAYEPEEGVKDRQRFVTVWAARGDGPDTRAYFGVPDYQAHGADDAVKAAGYQRAALHVLRGSDGRRYFSSVWTTQPMMWSARWELDEPEYEFLQTPNRVQVEVGMVRTDPPRWLTAADQAERLARAEADVKAGINVGAAHLRRGFALTALGRDREALSSWNALIEAGTVGELFWNRALAHARLGQEKEARQDLEMFRKRVEARPAKETLAALVDAALGQEEEAFKALEARLQRVGRNTDIVVTTAACYARVAGWIAARHPERARTYRDRAVALLRQAVAQGFTHYRSLVQDEHFEPLRDHPGLIELFAKVPFTRQYVAVWHHSSDHESQELHGLSPADHLRKARALAARGYRPAALAMLQADAGKPMVAASVWHYPRLTEADRDALARRQARAAITLLHLGRPAPLWPLLRHRPDPRLRSFLIHDLEPLGVSPLTLVRRLRAESDVSARRALLLALGDCSPDALPQKERSELVRDLIKTFQTDPDPGIHSAVDWLLRRWRYGASLTLADMKPGPADGKDWFVNRVGQTFAVVRGPVEFYMGSPVDRDYVAGETLHLVRMEHSFAISTREVTEEQMRRLFPMPKRRGKFLPALAGPEGDGPIAGITWFDAAAYCRRLSELEGVPEDQMCYPPVEQIKAGMTLPENYLARTGYRLPSEAEWEFACRAGASTPRFYGSSEELLGRYAWVLANSDTQLHPVGRLRPNDLGLFDVYGNATEWCQEGYYTYELEKAGRATVYREDTAPVHPGRVRMIRGGGFDIPGDRARSACRSGEYPSGASAHLGFRIVRTLR
jgi:formylglycine-generating enzyme required for sulfatase activity/tRNA A-37 threonylcarbamoyl transferase component Bud32